MPNKRKDIVNWEKEIEGLTGPFPEVGSDPPAMESITVEQPKKKNLPDLDDIGEFTKIITEVFIFEDFDNGKRYSMQRHEVEDYGEMTMRDALISIRK